MQVGFEVFAQAAAAGFPVYSAGSPRGKAIEVFPHATAVVLAGCLAPKGVRKRAWRDGGAAGPGRAHRRAGLARPDRRRARRAHRAARARRASGSRPATRGGRDRGAVGGAAGRALPARGGRRRATPQPLFAYCACGDPACDRLVRGEFAPGHDAKRKAMLWARAREGARRSTSSRRAAGSCRPRCDEPRAMAER